MYNQNSGYGQALLNMITSKVGSFGRVFVVFSPDDTADYNYQTIQELMKVDPEGNVRFFTDLEEAYDACQTDNNDVILLSSHSHHTVDTMLTWAKNRIHVIGMGAAGMIDTQPEVKLGTLAADAAATIKVTGFGNSFTNLYISNNGTHTNSVTALWDAGEGTVYTDCQFAKMSDIDVAEVSHVEARGDSTSWKHCKFGVDWSTISAARFGLLIKGTGGGARMKHNIFEDCYFVVASSEANYEHIHVYDTDSLAFSNIWKNCVFHNALIDTSSAAAIDDAVNSASGLVEGNLFFVNPATNSTSFCTTADQLTIVGVVPAGATSGIAVTPS
jgi:hypothetical protein